MAAIRQNAYLMGGLGKMDGGKSHWVGQLVVVHTNINDVERVGAWLLRRGGRRS